MDFLEKNFAEQTQVYKNNVADKGLKLELDSMLLYVGKSAIQTFSAKLLKIV